MLLERIVRKVAGIAAPFLLATALSCNDGYSIATIEQEKREPTSASGASPVPLEDISHLLPVEQQLYRRPLYPRREVKVEKMGLCEEILSGKKCKPIAVIQRNTTLSLLAKISARGVENEPMVKEVYITQGEQRVLVSQEEGTFSATGLQEIRASAYLDSAKVPLGEGTLELVIRTENSRGKGSGTKDIELQRENSITIESASFCGSLNEGNCLEATTTFDNYEGKIFAAVQGISTQLPGKMLKLVGEYSVAFPNGTTQQRAIPPYQKHDAAVEEPFAMAFQLLLGEKPQGGTYGIKITVRNESPGLKKKKGYSLPAAEREESFTINYFQIKDLRVCDGRNVTSNGCERSMDTIHYSVHYPWRLLYTYTVRADIDEQGGVILSGKVLQNGTMVSGKISMAGDDSSGILPYFYEVTMTDEMIIPLTRQGGRYALVLTLKKKTREVSTTVTQPFTIVAEEAE